MRLSFMMLVEGNVVKTLVVNKGSLFVYVFVCCLLE